MGCVDKNGRHDAVLLPDAMHDGGCGFHERRPVAPVAGDSRRSCLVTHRLEHAAAIEKWQKGVAGVGELLDKEAEHLIALDIIGAEPADLFGIEELAGGLAEFGDFTPTFPTDELKVPGVDGLKCRHFASPHPACAPREHAVEHGCEGLRQIFGIESRFRKSRASLLTDFADHWPVAFLHPGAAGPRRMRMSGIKAAVGRGSAKLVQIHGRRAVAGDRLGDTRDGVLPIRAGRAHDREGAIVSLRGGFLLPVLYSRRQGFGIVIRQGLAPDQDIHVGLDINSRLPRPLEKFVQARARSVFRKHGVEGFLVPAVKVRADGQTEIIAKRAQLPLHLPVGIRRAVVHAEPQCQIAIPVGRVFSCW